MYFECTCTFSPPQRLLQQLPCTRAYTLIYIYSVYYHFRKRFLRVELGRLRNGDTVDRPDGEDSALRVWGAPWGGDAGCVVRRGIADEKLEDAPAGFIPGGVGPKGTSPEPPMQLALRLLLENILAWKDDDGGFPLEEEEGRDRLASESNPPPPPLAVPASESMLMLRVPYHSPSETGERAEKKMNFYCLEKRHKESRDTHTILCR